MQLRGAVSAVDPHTEPVGQSALVVQVPPVATQMVTPSPHGSTHENPAVQSAPVAQGP
jgi:hypothetical protein